MQITLEQIDFLREKAGLSYEESRELLEKSEGDFLKALEILLADGRIAFNRAEEAGKERKMDKEETMDHKEETVWQKIWKKGKTSKINVNRPEGTLLRIPLVLGVAGAFAFPRLASWGMLGLLLTRCSLEIDLQ